MKKVHINLLICTPSHWRPHFERANDKFKVYFIIFFIFYLSILHNLFTIWFVAIGKSIWKEYEFNESSSSYHNTIHLMTYSTIKAKSKINARLNIESLMHIFWQWPLQWLKLGKEKLVQQNQRCQFRFS